MECDKIENLRQNHMKIVDDLEPRCVLDNLYEDKVLRDNDVEVINTGKTRKERCQLLLTLLPRKGPLAYALFQKALSENNYEHLARDLDLNNLEISHNNTSRVPVTLTFCSRCKPIFPNKTAHPYFSIIFQKHCCLIMDNIDPNDIIDHCYQERLIHFGEYEHIRSGNTRQDRCVTMLQTLAKCSTDEAVEIFCRSLLKPYAFVYQKIIETLPEIRSNKRHITLAQNPSVIVIGDKSNVTPIPTVRKRKQNKIRKNHYKHSFSDSESTHFEDNYRQKYKVCQIQQFPTDGKFPSKRLIETFDCLSDLVNNGEYEQFNYMSMNVRQKYSNNPDMLCTLHYLHASLELLREDYATAKTHIKAALKCATATSNPEYFILEIITAKSRRYRAMKKYGKLQNALSDGKMTIASDTKGCCGRAAGWLYINDASTNTAQMTTVNIRTLTDTGVYKKFHDMAFNSFHLALANFDQDRSKDREFGISLTVCRLVILLMRCGDNGLTMGILIPPADDISRAGEYLKQVEDCDIVSPRSLDVHHFLAKCDYQFHLGNFVRAYHNAYSAFEIATKLNMLEFRGHASNRVIFLQNKVPFLKMCNGLERTSEMLFWDESSSDKSRESP